MPWARTFRLVAGVAVALLVAACGGGDDGAQPESTTPTVAPSTAVPLTTTTSQGDEAAIIAAFTAFFDGGNPDIAAKVALLERGEAMRSMLTDAAANAQFALMSTDVRSVRVLDPAGCASVGVVSPCAEVVHDVLVGSFPAIAGKTSYAVRVGAAWLVSAKAWCEVVAIGGASCPET